MRAETTVVSLLLSLVLTADATRIVTFGGGSSPTNNQVSLVSNAAYFDRVRRQLGVDQAMVVLGLPIGRQMLTDDFRHAHPLQQRPDHGQRAEVTTLSRRLLSVPRERHAHKMRKLRRGRNTSFAESTGSGNQD